MTLPRRSAWPRWRSCSRRRWRVPRMGWRWWMPVVRSAIGSWMRGRLDGRGGWRGGAFLPLDVSYPVGRLRLMADDAAPVVIVCDRASVPVLEPLRVPLLVADDPQTAELLDGCGSDLDAVVAARPQHPAYVMFTSGSAGRPKGVVIEHRSLNAYLAWAREAYPAVRDRVLVHSPLSFDLTVTGLLTPLTCGGCVHLADLDDAGSLDGHVGAPAFVKGTPSHLGLLLNLPSRFSPTRNLVLGGESLVGEVLDQWRARHPAVTVINE